MSQQSIDSYLKQRKDTVKRKAVVDDSFAFHSKVRILEDCGEGKEEARCLGNSELSTPNDCISTHKNVKLISSKKESLLADDKLSEGRCTKSKGKAVIKLTFDGGSATPLAGKHISRERSPHIESRAFSGTQSQNNVSFIKKGCLSPMKKNIGRNADITSYLMKQSDNKQDGLLLNSTESSNQQEKVSTDRKELSLGDIKKCISRSSRINELRNSISRLNKGFEKLSELNSTNTNSGATSLKEFKSIDLLVPASPTKQSPLKTVGSPLTSPTKDLLMSPRKIGFSPIKSPIKVPAYERLASLAVPTSSLTLPHHYRWIGEVFKAMEQVSSMLYNRKESITFSKVRKAAQEMLKRNVTEKHMAQIRHISPQMYSFTREKVKNFGATAKRDEYELVMKPNVRNEAGCSTNIMTPAIILHRQRSFFNLLVDKVKDHHGVFLGSLDPPLDIPKEKLKRWHPEFEIEHIPDVEEGPLPEVPNVEKFSTAQDVLTHFREKFNCNTKMEKALMKLAEAKARGLTTDEQKATGLTADGNEMKNVTIDHKSQTENLSETASSSNVLTNPAFKGIPKALLEKIRAKQAAKALESMTRSPAQERDSMMYQRLPDLARLLRNLFVTEKKSVLPFETVISTLDNSFRVKMSIEDLKKHVRLLGKVLPSWLTFYEFRKTEFLKIVKDSDMSKIMSSLGDLATKHSI